MKYEDPQRWARAGIPYVPPEERARARESAEGPVPDPQTWEYDYFKAPLYYRSGAKQERAKWRLHRPYVLAEQPVPEDFIVVWEMDDPKRDFDDEGYPTTGPGLYRTLIEKADVWAQEMGYPKPYARWLAGVHNIMPLHYTRWDPAKLVPLVACGWCPVLEAQPIHLGGNVRDLRPVTGAPSLRTHQPTNEDDFHVQHTTIRAERKEFMQRLRAALNLL